MDYRKTRIYAITISPPIYRGRQEYIYEEHSVLIRRHLNKFSSYYLLYPEFSQDARLHYHGVIRIKDFIKYGKTKHMLDRQVGYTNIKHLLSHIDHLRWLMYCKKEYTIEMFKPIIYKSLKKKKKYNIDTTELDHGLYKYGFKAEDEG